jgi:hypothetical protein
MNLRFTIWDYTNDVNGVATTIDEPIGWDLIKLRLTREKEWHGFLDFADGGLDSMQFIGDGFSILKTAYDTYGTIAKVELLVEFQCADGDTYQELYLGRFVFSTYKDICGDECLAEITLEALNCLMIFRNRYDQQVDLDSLNTFDKVCTDFDDDVVAEFVAPHTINVLGEFAGTVEGVQITITGSGSNNGVFTVVSYSFDPFYDKSTFVVAESITDEAYGGVHLQGCLLVFQLPSYTGLNKPITLPSKNLRIKSRWKDNGTVTYDMNILLPFDPIHPALETPIFSPAMPAIVSELVTTAGGSSFANNDVLSESNPPDVWIDFGGFNLICDGPARMILDVTADLVTHGTCPAHAAADWKLVIVKAQQFNPVFGLFTGAETAGPNRWEFATSTNSLTVNTTIDFPNFATGDKVWVYFQFDISSYLPNTGPNPNCFPDLQLSRDSSLTFEYDSVCNNTDAKVYMINEVLSRCVEAYTNDCMRVYSDYFGRTDAQPYASGSDGCGSLRAIANGLKIRNATKANDTEPLMTVSMKQVFDALNATDNIGLGLEDDPNRLGNNLIRVEPQEYFYNNSILMECDSIRYVKREVDQSQIYSIIKTGFAKFETWNENGLYDLFANREYRTELSTVKNELDRVCKFIASDYAIEITRRLYGSGTSDWRYDQDIFFLCLQTEANIGTAIFIHNVSSDIIYIIPPYDINVSQFNVGDSIVITGTTSNDGTYTVVSATISGGNIAISVAQTVTGETATGMQISNTTSPFAIVEEGVDSPTDILFPDTVKNYRIAPSRNLMRWVKTLFQSYRTFIGKKLKFTGGTGNIIASGEVLTPCRLENGVISENQDISLDNFASPTDNYPLFYPELVTFEYPMSYGQYLTVKANPYGLIGYQCGNNAMEYGWIEDMQYSPYNGLVNFTLRPKIAI